MENQNLEYALFRSRFLAYIIDWSIFTIPIVIIGFTYMIATFQDVDIASYSTTLESANQTDGYIEFEAGGNQFLNYLPVYIAILTTLYVIFLSSLTAGRKQAT